MSKPIGPSGRDGFAVGLGLCTVAAVGEAVAKQRLLAVGSATKPSRHLHTHSLPAFTGKVKSESHPPPLSSQGCCVGLYVGAANMPVLGLGVGDDDGLMVGCSVGALVAMHFSELLGSVTKPSRHSQNAVSNPSADFATTQIVETGSQPWFSRQGLNDGI